MIKIRSYELLRCNTVIYVSIGVLMVILLVSTPMLYSQETLPIASQAELDQMAVEDSLITLREEIIAKETGISETDNLIKTAEKLEISPLYYGAWKSRLGLEARNKQLDLRSLKDLGISIYQAELAKQTLYFGFNESNSLSEIATIKKIPIKKLKSLLDINPLNRAKDSYSIQVHGFTPEQITDICEEFDSKTALYGSSITVVGMLIVFSSLAIISLVVSQLVRFDRMTHAKDSKIKITKSGILKAAPKNVNRDTIVAAITALHLHIHQIEERRRLILTFKRTPLNLWNSTNVISMPNLNFQTPRRMR